MGQGRTDPELGRTLQRAIRRASDRAHARAGRAEIAARYAKLRAGNDPALARFAEDAERCAAAARAESERAEAMAQEFFGSLREDRAEENNPAVVEG